MEIGSSDEDENASRFAWSGVILSSYNQPTSIGLRSALKRRYGLFLDSWVLAM